MLNIGIDGQLGQAGWVGFQGFLKLTSTKDEI
jgi:hypothetical protein